MKKIKSMFENLGKNIILSLLFIVIFLNFNLEDISKVITGVVAICGLIIAYSYNNGAKNQREQQLLQNKREYYNKFVEAYINKMNYYPALFDTLEAVEANEKFCIEASRLTIYASKDVIECVAKIQRGEKVESEELILLIRKDLGLCDMEKIPLGLVVSNLVIVNGKVVDKNSVQEDLTNKNIKN